ncbi:cellulase family glycosylhydrolase [Flavobacterium piscis]|uniref:Aryl-phospho-beta-D-glucosidase BglC (GH1 family) n=1 Tax=Flavobacterium piscis TaxID=1114874 RepID=A0ABU1Y6K4_9FLAO|nr:cellulase family glycosylhydrolase [Flavobacterium piscis]MDR7209849.1 aryl-phospho-beta-D-glucosidase BglC (GH1 family) [Flavobacterium piscis]
MKFKHFHKILLLLVAVFSIASCVNNDEETPELTVSVKSVSFVPDGGTSEEITIAANSIWSVSNSAATWLQLSKESGSSGNTTITLTAATNVTAYTRSVILTVKAANGQARRITVTQTGNKYPTYNMTPKEADATGMTHTAAEIIAAMKYGINIGNTFELRGVNADPTLENIKFIKQLGFKAVRLPCGPNYVGNADKSSLAKIDADYLLKIKKVVEWCVDNGLYVLVNIHWDGGWLENNVTAIKQEEVNARQKALWEQMATALRDFDEHLLFASANEPNAEDAAQTKILLGYHKTFINAVRSTGGQNTYRTLVLQGHPEHIYAEDFTALNDPTPNRLAFEWHNYTPSSMTILADDKVDGGWDNVRFYWSAANHSTLEPGRNCQYGEEAELLVEYNKIKTKFIDKGIPCLMGEYSSNRWNNSNKFIPKEMDKHNKSIDDWYTFNTKQCHAIGGAPFVWDTGGIFNRNTNTVNDQRSLNAIMAAGN